ncbi:hypothetical protein [Mesorhizobium sp. RMAD-H1]|uniref:hypothetical protein n=1 Tax=Mesorhizobium sp. RMAD-H1 TaxID=2587065 RepID=UPI0017FA2582|nr:hypothetical protein [Mesorhizobium sp. RMAD-H1]MBB2972030.1 hypothetical protein [Mesorhizobium sp. RMAD-H1]
MQAQRRKNHADFASILSEIERQSAESSENLRPVSFDFLDGLLHLAATHAVDRRSDSILFEPEIEAESPLPSTDPDEIARELRLSSGMSSAELAQIRRRFAALNHPDRVAPHLRERASDRMKIANALIDRALAGGISREI